MKNGKNGFGVGAASIVMIAAVLCLTVFSVLSLVASHNDSALSVRTVEAAQTYYTADRKAQFIIAEVDELVRSGGGFEMEGVTVEEGKVSFAVIVDGSRVLNVVLDTANGGAEILEYRLEKRQEADG